MIWSLALVGPVREPEPVEHHLHLVASCARGLCFAVVDSKVDVVATPDPALEAILRERRALLASVLRLCETERQS
jgi:hypothetical protein